MHVPPSVELTVPAAVGAGPSELFFGQYEASLRGSSKNKASIGRSQAEILGPLAEDGFYSRSTMIQRVAKERQDQWSVHNFDRSANFFTAP